MWLGNMAACSVKTFHQNSQLIQMLLIVVCYTDRYKYFCRTLQKCHNHGHPCIRFSLSIIPCLYKEITLTKFSARYGEVSWKDGPLLDSLSIGCGVGIYAVYAFLDDFVNGWFFFVDNFWDFAGNYTMLPTKLHR